MSTSSRERYSSSIRMSLAFELDFQSFPPKTKKISGPTTMTFSGDSKTWKILQPLADMFLHQLKTKPILPKAKK